MNATRYDGKRYGGQFFQITKQTTVDNIGPRWSGDWYASWGRRRGWEHWDAMPTPDYSTHYTRRVVANLGTASGEHMRCKFQLAQISRWRLSLVSDARRQERRCDFAERLTAAALIEGGIGRNCN